jgi:hypothetical protein
MKKEYVFDVTTEAIVKTVVRVEADDFESAVLLCQSEADSGEVLWKYDGVVEGADIEMVLRG